MAILNTAARNTMVGYAGVMLGTGTLVIYAGATALATHTMTGFGSEVGGVIVANAIADVTIADGGVADSVKLINGANETTLSVGIAGSGAEVIVSSLTYVKDGTSKINSITVTFPAS